MKIYTIKDKNNILYPKAILEIENKAEAVKDGKIIEVDYGEEAVNEYLQKPKNKDFLLAICELTLVN